MRIPGVFWRPLKWALVCVIILPIATVPGTTQTAIHISDVIGLTNQLAIRPQAGVGYSTNRTAVINSSGQIDGASGNLSDCIHVDGSSGPCVQGGGAPSTMIVDGEVLLGNVNGTNNAFTLNNSPSPVTSLHLFANGLRLEQGVDYSIAGNAITFKAGAIPGAGAILQADYRH
jgi:hypothetical protein